jgi:hypothetical protein
MDEAVAAPERVEPRGSGKQVEALVEGCQRGKREQVQEHLATGTTMYREMDMRFSLEKAETKDIH